jgi:serine/threonine-protein kinase RsbW
MEFRADLTLLTEMLDYIRVPLEKKNISLQELRRIELAAEEALVNVISYAYPKKSGKEKLILDVFEPATGQFQMRIKDTGIPFNPSAVEIDPKIDRPIEERRVGGLGLFLIRELADEISYQRIKNENVLTVTFRLKSV